MIVNSKKVRVWKDIVLTNVIFGLDVSYLTCDFVVSLGPSGQMVRLCLPFRVLVTVILQLYVI
jgi:hypothetical protein